MAVSEVETPPEVEQILEGEQGGLARRICRSIEQSILYYRKEYQLSRPDAIESVVGRAGALGRQGVADFTDVPPDQLNWDSLMLLFDEAPDLGQQKWDEIKAEARRQLAAGSIGLDAIDEPRPWDRAVYMAIREDLGREWDARNGIERCLIDQMAQAYCNYLHWQAVALRFHNIDPFTANQGMKEQLPRLSTSEAVDRSTGLADRYHKMFIRAQRALRDMRRYAVIVQSAGQVNVGQQQVNVASGRMAEAVE